MSEKKPDAPSKAPHRTATTESKEGAATAAPGINWADPDIPAGNAPALPRWPLVVSALAFAAWVVFLVAMAVMRFRTTPV